jgi:hypothetical protein
MTSDLGIKVLPLQKERAMLAVAVFSALSNDINKKKQDYEQNSTH